MLSKINFSADLLLITTLVSFLGTVFYWFFDLGLTGRIATILGTLTIYFIIYRNRPSSQANPIEKSSFSWNNFLLLVLLVFSGLYLYFHQSSLPLQTPWSEVGGLFWLAYGLIGLVGLITIRSNKKLGLLNIRLWWLITFGIVSFIYFSSFGFDPFIHQAAEKTIAAQGEILPKTPYYIGQYSLVVIINWLSHIEISLIERWLLPILTAFLLPALLLSWSKKLDLTDKTAKLLIWLLPLIGWPIFIVTNPQNLAYFFLLTSLLAIIGQADKKLVWSSALASLACQPLAGLPAISLALFSGSGSSKNKLVKQILAYGLTGLILPLSFWYADWQQSGSWQLVFPPLKETLAYLGNFLSWKNLWPNQENLSLNLIYSWQSWQKIITLLLIIVGYKIAKKNQPLVFKLCLKSSLSVILAAVLTSLVPFSFLIDYERYNYLLRFLFILLIINLPLILLTLKKLADSWLGSTNQKIIWPTSLALTSILIFSLYLNYPRLDNYSNAKGLSVGAADLAAVEWIENNAKEDYSVLANQQVSATALGRYGFYKGSHQRYLKDSLFYYPIPTSGIMYGYYLDMVDNYPSRDTIKKAADKAGVSEAYFVLNRYWYGFEKLAREAKNEADQTIELNNRQIIIFGYYFN